MLTSLATLRRHSNFLFRRLCSMDAKSFHVASASEIAAALNVSGGADPSVLPPIVDVRAADGCEKRRKEGMVLSYLFAQHSQPRLSKEICPQRALKITLVHVQTRKVTILLLSFADLEAGLAWPRRFSLKRVSYRKT